MSQPPIKLSDLLAPAVLRSLTASGNDLIEQVGFDVVRGVVFDVLTGKNVRDSTETLTRRRLAILNLATFNLFMEGQAASADFVEQLPYLATEILTQKPLSRSERWLAQWILGLNDKAFQNVLRGSVNALVEYRDHYIKTCTEVIERYVQDYGELRGHLKRVVR